MLYVGIALPCFFRVHILQEYDLEDVKEVATPTAENFFDELEAHAEEPIQDEERYRNMLAALLFLSNRTRPDISTAVAILSQFVSRPTQFLVKSVKRVFGYLKGTSDFGLLYNLAYGEEINLHFYADSDFSGDKTTRKSRSGWVAVLNGTAFSWASRKQSFVALSTTEAEFVAMSES